MEKVITAAEANREFSRLLREVRDGETFVITSHGKPVARLMPPHELDDATREAVRNAYFEELKSRPVQNIGKWTRDELYDE